MLETPFFSRFPRSACMSCSSGCAGQSRFSGGGLLVPDLAEEFPKFGFLSHSPGKVSFGLTGLSGITFMPCKGKFGFASLSLEAVFCAFFESITSRKSQERLVFIVGSDAA